MDSFFLILSAFGLITSGRQLLKVWPLLQVAPRVFWTYATLVLFWLVFIVRILTDTPALAVVTISLLGVHLYLKYFGIKRGMDGVRPDATPRKGHQPSPLNPFENHPFVAAVCRGDVEEVEKRLQAGEDLEQVVLSYTPLMHAIEREETEMITYLIDHGADVNAREHGKHENKAESPISLACLSGQEDVVAMLLQKGSDPTYYNVENLNLLDQTIEARHPECEALLRRHGMTPVESNEENA